MTVRTVSGYTGADDTTKRWLVTAWATVVVRGMYVNSAIFKMKPSDDVARAARAAGFLGVLWLRPRLSHAPLLS